MNEKRFELKWRDTGEVLYDNETGLEHRIYSPDYRFHVRDMMNELAEKKEILEVQLQSAENEIGKLGSEINMLTDTCHDCCKEIRKENEELKRQVKETIFDIDVMIDVSAPNTERIGLLLDLKEKMIETFGEWVIE